MKNTIKYLMLAVLVLTCVSGFAQTQNYVGTIYSTTLSSAVSDTKTTTFVVASATNITAPTFTTPGSSLYIDAEEVDVIAVNGTVLTVRRGADGTAAQTHLKGAQVYVAQSAQFQDYQIGGSCVSPYNDPWINTKTGDVFRCYYGAGSASTGVWQRVAVNGAQHQPVSLIMSAASTQNNSTTFATVGSLMFPVSPNQNYTLNCTIVWQVSSALTAGPKFQLTGPIPTSVVISAEGGVGASSYTQGSVTTFSSAITIFGSASTSATPYVSHLYATVVNGATAGSVAVQAAANGAGTLTILPSNCIQQ